MRAGLFLLLTGATVAGAPLLGADLNTIVNKMQQRSARQNAGMCGYTGTRIYTLHNSHLSNDMVMKYRVTMSRASGKRFKLISKQHPEFLARRALKALVQSEPTTRKQEKQGNIDRANYRFALLGEDVLDGHRCYVLQLTPRRNSQYLVLGKAWVDAQSYAVREIKGKLAKSVSFWVGKPEVDARYAKFDGFWMPSHSWSLSHVKLVGKTTVIVEFSYDRFQRCAGSVPSAP
ncbi:MAG: hypothetical protein ACRD6B_00685 [Bryobacteraceae bacterium]